MEVFLGPPLERLGGWLLEAEAGVGLVLLVGLSMSLSHAFALLANRLIPRQIALRLVLDGLVHLNVVTLLHLRFALPWAEPLLLATPGFLLALVLVALLFRQSWRGSYLRLAGSIRSGGSEATSASPWAC
ncbi:MAG: hypothetical protein ACKO22_06820 [Cyanobium sp.]